MVFIWAMYNLFDNNVIGNPYTCSKRFFEDANFRVKSLIIILTLSKKDKKRKKQVM